MGKCKTCGKNCEGDYCFSHKPRRQMARRVPPTTQEMREHSPVEAMHDFFQKIWKKRTHVSEVSGEFLGSEPSSGYFHHILAKSKYPELAYIEENIILLTLDEHANVEGDMYKYEEINIRRKKLLIKYNLS